MFAVGRCHIVVAPAYGAQVEQRGAKLKVAEGIHRTKVDGGAKACHTKLVDVNLVDAHITSVFAHFRCVSQILDVSLHGGIGHHIPSIVAQLKLCFVEVGIYIAGSHQHLQCGTDAQLFAQLMRMVQGNLGVSIGMRLDVGYVIGAVAHSFFEQAEDVGGQFHRRVGTRTDAYGVIAAKTLEANRQHIDFCVYAHMVGAFKARHRFLTAHTRIEERGGLAVDVIEDVLHAQRAALCHVDVRQTRE